MVKGATGGKVLSWNCQGLGNKATIGYLRDVWKQYRPDFLFLSETKQSTLFMEIFVGHFGYKHLKMVDPIGCSGGLALFYNNDFNVTIIYASNRLIDIEAVYKNKIIYLSFIYGDPVPKNREQVWERLTRIGLTRNAPWFLIGDFNELTGNHEKRGGKLRHASSFLPFNSMIQDCRLLDFPYLGDWLSWRGWRDKKTIRCRLDRALANEDWHDLFCNSFIEYLTRIASDHSLIIATIADKIPRGKHNFKFDKRWIGKEGLLEAISNGWYLGGGPNEENFVNKMTSSRRSISQWRKEQSPYGRKTIDELKSELTVAQSDDSRTREEITDLTTRLKEAYRDEESYWYQKSRSLWMKEGDNNSKYFHALTKQRRARNRITGLHDANGVWSTEDKDIQNIAVSYFGSLFSTSNPQILKDSLEEIQTTITEQINDFLTAPATELEIRAVLFMMHPEKAPDPDGMTALFFQKAWDIIKKDLLSLVNSFLLEGFFDKRLNTTNICLIPKTERPTRMTELWPISLCNVGYKVISKLLCQRLKTVLPSLISETQSAFVEGRLISDNILIA